MKAHPAPQPAHLSQGYGRRPRGFTLIELSIVALVIAILAAIAVPSYQNSVRKSRRADAKNALVALALEQEKFRADCPEYAHGISAAAPSNTVNGTCDTATPANNVIQFDSTSSEGYYNISIPAANASTYSLQAAAVAGTSQADDTGCTTFTLNQDGDKTPASCW